VQSLLAHLFCYLPIITSCYYTYFAPPDFKSKDPQTEACQESYRLYLLVAGSCLIMPSIMLFYIVCCYKRHSPDRVQDMASLIIFIECIIFSGIFIYFKVVSG